MRWVLPSLVVALPASWAAAGYFTFKENCKTIPHTQYFSQPGSKIDGFFLTGRHISANELLEKGAFQFVEEVANASKIRQTVAVEGMYKNSPPRAKSEWVPTAAAKSLYEVTELEPKPVEYWWKPPIFKYDIEVKERKSAKLLARATDLVFGGGLLGTYLILLGGDQDFDRLSCGYASAEPGPWRPTLASRVRSTQYMDADLRFLVKAFELPSEK